ncbi:hypothetical protein [Treponema denticola]|uniref:hypothetical protein n=1 Tax=Treponema denticola TaxID=158 RepID=UPI0021033AB5|nr:hypothetical protein [Treponema denticola]UTY27081.1 hypothetical protein E4N77_10795 [Treponema denticola]
MKNLIYVLALIGTLIGCNKNENATNNAITTEVQNETSTVVQNSAGVETNTEEPWIALIEKEITGVSFKNGEYKIAPTTGRDFFTINLDLGNGLYFYVTVKSKNYTDLDTMDIGTPEFFQEKAKAVLSASTLPQYLGGVNWAVEINGYKFSQSMGFTKFSTDISLFQLSYYTTTPMYTLECNFYKNPCDEFKEEAPQYFEEGKWKMNMPSGKHGIIEFAEKIVDGTIESKTARELYKISEDFMKTIEIKTHEPTDEVQNESSSIAQNATNVENITETKTKEPWIALIEKEVTEISFKNGEYTIIPTDKEDYFEISIKLDKGLSFFATLKRKNDTNLYSMEDISPESFQKKARDVLSVSVLPQYLGYANWAVQRNGYKFGHGISLSRFDTSISLFQSSYYTTTPMYTLQCTFFRNSCDEFKQEAPQYFEEGEIWKMKMPSGEIGEVEFAQKIVDGTIESKTARELYKISEDFMKTIEIKTVE